MVIEVAGELRPLGVGINLLDETAQRTSAMSCDETGDVRLRQLDKRNLAALLETAVADADPEEVMPVIDGVAGWTEQRKQAFLDFHHQRSISTPNPVEITYVIEHGGRIVGAARLSSTGEDVEAGVWIGKSWRGKGIGRAVAVELLAAARNTTAARFVASTTTDNHASRRLLAGIGAQLAVHGDEVAAALDLTASYADPVLNPACGRPPRADG